MKFLDHHLSSVGAHVHLTTNGRLSSTNCEDKLLLDVLGREGLLAIVHSTLQSSCSLPRKCFPDLQ
jgi:hypothetical protein